MVRGLQTDEIPLFQNRGAIEIDGKRWDEIEPAFSRELSETAPHKHLGDKTPRFTQAHGEYLYARLKAVQTYCEEEYDNLVTVWLSLTAEEKVGGKWVHPLRHDDGFRSNSVKQALYRVRKRLDVEDWAGMWLMAPRKTGYSHKHYALWLDVSEDYGIRELQEVFHPVIDAHVRSHPTATSARNPYGKAIQVREGDDCEGLPAEVARNFPEIGPGRGVPSPDVRSITNDWSYVRIWCAFYWYDDRIRQYELGEFREIAEEAKPEGDWKFGVGWVEE